MRRLFNLLKNSSETNPLELPSLPLDLSYSELSYKTKRGFLARKLGQFVDFNSNEVDILFFQSLSKSSFIQVKNDNEIEYLLYLSELMLKWHEEKKEIKKQIDSLPIRNDLQNAMLKAYDIYKQELFPTPIESTFPDKVIPFQQDKGEWEIYRDVIFAATQGQFLLISEDEVSKYKNGKVLCDGYVKSRSDIPICRNLAKECLEGQGFNTGKVMSLLLVLSEAISNIIKHAEEGKMTLVENKQENEMYFVIEDRGPGFPLEELPKTTLLAGYSTKKSLGQGFTLMMKMTKQISLFTSPKGSTIILIIDTSNMKEGKLIDTR